MLCHWDEKKSLQLKYITTRIYLRYGKRYTNIIFACIAFPSIIYNLVSYKERKNVHTYTATYIHIGDNV